MLKALLGIESRASIESPSVSLNDPAIFDLLGSTPTDAGVPVNEQVAMMLPAFWQAVNLISADVAKIPLNLWRYTDQGTDIEFREIDRSSPAFRVVRWQANEEQTAYDFWEMMLGHALVWRNAYAYIKRDGSRNVTGMYPLLPDRTYREKLNGVWYYRSEIDGEIQSFHPNDILHIKGLSFDGKLGLKLCEYARHAIGKIIAAGTLQSKFFKNGGRVGGVLQLPGAMSKGNRDKMEKGFKQTYSGPDAAFLTVILREGAQFKEAQRSFLDTQMTQVNDQDVGTVARLFSLPPHKLGLKTAAGYKGLEEENKAYNDSCLSPWFHRITAQCWLRLLPMTAKRKLSHWFEHVTGALLWADSKTLAAIATNGVRGGWLKPNEGRKWFNLPPDPNGSQLLIPSGMVLAGQPEAQRSLESLIASTRTRLVKRLRTQAKKHVKHGPEQVGAWLDGDFRTNEAVAQEMFKDIRGLQHDDIDHAKQIMDQFREQVLAAVESGELNEILED